MPSQYRPQILGWIGDLDKGSKNISGADDRLLYANDNYCAFLRKTSSDQIFYLCVFTIAFILSIPLIYLSITIILDLDLDSDEDTLIFITFIVMLIASFVGLYLFVRWNSCYLNQ